MQIIFSCCRGIGFQTIYDATSHDRRACPFKLVTTEKMCTSSNQCENNIHCTTRLQHLTGGKRTIGISLYIKTKQNNKTKQHAHQRTTLVRWFQTHIGKGCRLHYKHSSQITGTHTSLPGDNSRVVNLIWVYLATFCQRSKLWIDISIQKNDDMTVVFKFLAAMHSQNGFIHNK